MGKGNDPQTGCAMSAMDITSDIEGVRAQIAAAAARVAQLGAWPAYIDAQQSLTGRVPQPGERDAAGFDAGIACCLDLIPRDRQTLAATLHAAYTPAAVQQVRDEAGRMNADSGTCWWLAACSVCREGEIDSAGFSEQLREFERLASDPAARRAAAVAEIAAMRDRYEMRDDVPFATEDGGQQGAYLDGHRLAGMYSAGHDLYFLGTYEDSLGLEDFPFSDARDEQGRERSGPIHGSKQFVKLGSEDEYRRACRVARAHLGA